MGERIKKIPASNMPIQGRACGLVPDSATLNLRHLPKSGLTKGPARRVIGPMTEGELTDQQQRVLDSIEAHGWHSMHIFHPDLEAPNFTYSIGLRAPSAADLMQALGEWMAENQAGGRMYADPETDRYQGGATGEISSAAIHQMNELIRNMLNDGTAFARFAGEFISRFRLADLPAVPDYPDKSK